MSSVAGRSDPARVFLVTGASGTIGAATARAAAAAGFDLVLSGRRLERLESLADELRTEVRAITVAADVTEWADLQSMVSQTTAEFGRLDVALVNAGQSSHRSFLDGNDTHEEWREMVLTNVYGTAARPVQGASRADGIGGGEDPGAGQSLLRDEVGDHGDRSVDPW